jgi:hypothetical protein
MRHMAFLGVLHGMVWHVLVRGGIKVLVVIVIVWLGSLRG